VTSSRCAPHVKPTAEVSADAPAACAHPHDIPDVIGQPTVGERDVRPAVEDHDLRRFIKPPQPAAQDARRPRPDHQHPTRLTRFATHRHRFLIAHTRSTLSSHATEHRSGLAPFFHGVSRRDHRKSTARAQHSRNCSPDRTGRRKAAVLSGGSGRSSRWRRAETSKSALICSSNTLTTQAWPKRASVSSPPRHARRRQGRARSDREVRRQPPCKQLIDRRRNRSSCQDTLRAPAAAAAQRSGESPRRSGRESRRDDHAGRMPAALNARTVPGATAGCSPWLHPARESTSVWSATA